MASTIILSIISALIINQIYDMRGVPYDKGCVLEGPNQLNCYISCISNQGRWRCQRIRLGIQATSSIIIN